MKGKGKLPEEMMEKKRKYKDSKSPGRRRPSITLHSWFVLVSCYIFKKD